MLFAKSVASLFLIIISYSGLNIVKSPEPQQKVEIKELLHTVLDDKFTPDREVLINLVQLPPDSSISKHWHPGEEFHYYLEGDVEVKIEGEPTVHGKPGMVGHVPYQRAHTAIAGKNGAKILVFRVHTKGKPWKFDIK